MFRFGERRRAAVYAITITARYTPPRRRGSCIPGVIYTRGPGTGPNPCAFGTSAAIPRSRSPQVRRPELNISPRFREL